MQSMSRALAGFVAALAATAANAQGASAASDGRYELVGTRTIESGNAPLTLTSRVYVVDKNTGKVQLCQGTFTFATYVGSLKSAGASCSTFPYVAAPSMPSSGGFSSASDFGRQLSPGPRDSVLLMYWLVDNTTGAVQLCATNSQTADSRFPVTCVAARIQPSL